MSTRGVFGVRVGGVDKIAYNHSDSYPTGLGENLVNELVNGDLARLQVLAKDLLVVNGDKKPSAEEKQKYAKYTAEGIGEDGSWYQTLRELQGNLAEALEAGIMIDSAGFVEDSLCCEWGYIVNFDSGKFEVYRGLQKKPHTKGRFSPITEKAVVERLQGKDDKYYPIALVAEYDLAKLKKLPKSWAKKLEKEAEEG